MKKNTIKILAVVEMLCALTALFYCGRLIFSCLTLRNVESVEAVAVTLEAYAGVIDDHLDAIDNAGKNLPTYGSALASCAAMLNGDILKSTRQVEEFAAAGMQFQIPLLTMLTSGYSDRVKRIAADLNRTIPLVAESMQKSADTLEAHGEQEHRRMMETVIKTSITMRLLAEEVRTCGDAVTSSVTFILAFGIFSSLGMIVNSLAVILLSCSSKTQ
jgi:hypothetical protein